tara:strand:+ start:135 stop:452 length:318 start_codon:yes stop_codon:yes gene_type:complete
VQKIVKILCICVFLSSCADTTTQQSSLGEYGQFFEKQTRLYGSPAVEIVSKTPKSISFWFKQVYVKLSEATNAAQYHCQKNGRDAVLVKEEYLDGAVTKAYFECK